jgi:NAD(P)H-nitrite reductase large subunit|tara:strand:+ start:155 stop:439 length:285 start_codon:yes stop_codon:yes gene_type:complete
MSLPPVVETDEVICQCYQVNESTIRDVIAKDKLKDIDSVTEACEAGGGCHSCHILIQLFIDQYQEKITVMEDLVRDHGQKVKKKGILSRFFNKI